MTMPTPYYDQDGITIYHADCRDILPLLEPASVDLVLTDPPYGVAYSTGRRAADIRSSTRLAYDLATSPLLNDTAHQIAPLLNDTAHVYWFAAPSRLDVQMPIVRSMGVEIVNTIAWDKGNCTAGDLEATYGKQWEAIIFARKKRVPLQGARDRDVVRISKGSTADYHHPTQKPLDLIRFLIGKHSSGEGAILDPFLGGGTTALAALQMGRRCIAIEVNEQFCEIAAKRLQQARQPELIGGAA